MLKLGKYIIIGHNMLMSIEVLSKAGLLQVVILKRVRLSSRCDHQVYSTNEYGNDETLVISAVRDPSPVLVHLQYIALLFFKLVEVHTGVRFVHAYFLFVNANESASNVLYEPKRELFIRSLRYTSNIYRSSSF